MDSGTLGMVIMLSLFSALVVRAFWREIRDLMIVLCLALIFTTVIMTALEVQQLTQGG